MSARPSRIGPYRIVAELGRGSMAVVYRAIHDVNHREVALKVLSTDIASARDALARFDVEARATFAAAHPNIIPVLDMGAADGRQFIAMELVAGQTLADELTAWPEGMPVDLALRRATDLARALEYAHGRGILHRDVKPHNVLVDRSGCARLSDFGIAKMVAAATVTQTRAALGTPSYMSPEQATGARADARSDVYALGVVLFEMLAGRPPFAGDNALALMMQHVQTTAPSVTALRCDVPPMVARLVARCLEKDPNARFQTAGDLRLALETARADCDAAPFATRWWLRVRSASSQVRQRIVVATLVLMGLASGVWLSLQIPDAASPAPSLSREQETIQASRDPQPTSLPPQIITQPQGPPAQAAPAASRSPRPIPPAVVPRAPTRSASRPTPPPVKAPVAPSPVPTRTVAAVSSPPPPSPAERPQRPVEHHDAAGMILVPGGTFLMGDGHGRPEEAPLRNESCPDFYIDEFPVTVARFRAFVDAAHYRPEGRGWDVFEQSAGDQAPVVNVTWNDAAAYARWAGRRLPTECEWEKAARGPNGNVYPWGNAWSPRSCNWGDFDPLTNRMGKEDGLEGAGAVGETSGDRSWYGLADMGGNVSCWTADWFSPYAGNTAANPNYGEVFRVIRGGSWSDRQPEDLRCARRRGMRPHQSGPNVGFRTVASP